MNVDAGASTEGPGAVPPGLLLLAETDNVLIAVRDLAPGVQRTSDGRETQLIEPISLGHKVSACSMVSGERVVRCGVPIGSMSAPVEAGRWIHTHNLASDYIATFAHRGGTS